MKKLYTLQEVTSMIEQGKLLSLAGDERVLSQLPKGKWLAGSTPYFMDEQQGKFDQSSIYVDDFSSISTDYKITVYTPETISSITEDRYDNGFTVLVIPAFSKIHMEYALRAMDFDGIYDSPILGWISGMELDSKDTPTVYNGMTGESSSTFGICLHVRIPDTKMARLEILNIHTQNSKSPLVEFQEDSFTVSDCLIDGIKHNFAQYITENKIDIQSPIICQYAGAMINVCIKEVNLDVGRVDFLAPVFRGRKYKFAQHVANYAEEFTKQLPAEQNDNVAFSCNCVLNFQYGELKGKKAGFPGPITFGEIGYILLNQTMTYLEIVDIT